MSVLSSSRFEYESNRAHRAQEWPSSYPRAELPVGMDIPSETDTCHSTGHQTWAHCPSHPLIAKVFDRRSSACNLPGKLSHNGELLKLHRKYSLASSLRKRDTRNILCCTNPINTAKSNQKIPRALVRKLHIGVSGFLLPSSLHITLIPKLQYTLNIPFIISQRLHRHRPFP